MRRITVLLVAVATLVGVVAFTAITSRHATAQEAAPIFVTEVPAGYRDWKVVSVAHEAGDLNDIRAILGNDVAITHIGRESSRFRKARSLAESPGATSRRRKTTRPSAVPNLSWQAPPRSSTSSSWSRTQESTPRRAAGGTRHSIRTANRALSQV